MYTVIGHTRTRTFRVLWMLEELGQSYHQEPHVPGSEPVLAITPLGKVPVLLDGDVPLTDSAAILSYLADKHAMLTAPAGTPERALQDGVMHQILEEIDGVLWAAARHAFILPEDRRVPEVRNSLRWEFERNVNRLAERRQGPFLMGDHMTLPDILAVHCMNWAVSAKFSHQNSAFADYAQSLRERPAYKRAMATAGT